MGAAVAVQAKYERTTDPRKMMSHAVLNEAIRTDWDAIKRFLPARTATSLRYDKGATEAVAWDEGKTETKIYLPLNDGWYVPDGNPFSIPNGRPSNEDNPDALYLYRYQDRIFSGPLGRGYFGDYGWRVVYADGGWSGGPGVAVVGRDAIVANDNAPIVRSVEQSGATAPQIEVPREALAKVADPQKLREDAAQLRQIAENLQERFKGWDQALGEIVKPMLEKAARFIEVAEAIEQARK